MKNKKIIELHSSEFIKDDVEHNKNQEVPNIGDTLTTILVLLQNQYNDSHLNNRLLK